ncbi:MAG: NAD-dependent DNA ligase LigA [Sphaerochaetaceae bacterium]|nr:NAD-dependent DNA ligase LigA [Sphaerochaetaceae bacterium]
MHDIEQAQKEIAQLSEDLQHHQDLYYKEGQPIISDREYDHMMDRLLALETQFPTLKLPESPSQRVGSDLGSGFPEFAHTIPILSLDKAYTFEGVLQWIERSRQRGESRLSFVVEEKIDGVSLVLYYEKGYLVRAVTRGNGLVGNDVTPNAKTITSIPLKLSQPLTIAVRGEIFLPKTEFERINKSMEIPFANPRNLAAGTIRRLKSSETARIPLRMFAYEAFFDAGETPLTTHVEILKLLKDLGFYVNSEVAVFAETEDRALLEAQKLGMDSVPSGSFQALPSYIEKMNSVRDQLPHEIDGLVVKVNELGVRELLGYTGHHPRWALAFKFEAPEAQSRVDDIDVQVGRTGRITPVARVATVKVGNSMVSNVTLHNQDYINMLELAIGDSVAISKRGDVIPAIERVIEKNEEGNTTWVMPRNCPSCHSILVRQGAHTFCLNNDCPAQILGRITFFVGRDQMDIEGFGPETVTFLVNKGLVHDIPDIYTVNYADLVGEPGFGEKKASALAQAVEKSKDRPYRTVLAALGIPDFGRKTVDLLVDGGIVSMEELIDIVESQDRARFLAIKGFGEKTIDALFAQFADPAFRERIARLEKLGLHFKEEPTESEQLSQTFAQEVWCVTGSFTHFNPRSLALKEIEARGGRTTSSVTRKTTHLLAGEGAGSKLQQALTYGTRIVKEDEFLQLLEKE